MTWERVRLGTMSPEAVVPRARSDFRKNRHDHHGRLESVACTKQCGFMNALWNSSALRGIPDGLSFACPPLPPPIIPTIFSDAGEISPDQAMES